MGTMSESEREGGEEVSSDAVADMYRGLNRARWHVGRDRQEKVGDESDVEHAAHGRAALDAEPLSGAHAGRDDDAEALGSAHELSGKQT